MATTGVINATNLKVYVGGKPVAKAKSASVSLSMEPIDITSKDSASWKEQMAGQKSWSMSGDNLLQFDAASATYYRISDLQSALVSGTLVAVSFQTPTSGDNSLAGSGYFSSLELTGGVEEAATYSFSIQGTGTLTWGTVSA